MQVFFSSRDTDGHTLRDLALRRVQFVLRRMTWLVPQASVQLSDLNGPRGGVDKRCQIRFRTQNAGTVVITAVARDWRAALDSALTRANHTLLRLWRRRQDRRPNNPRLLQNDG